MRDASAIAMKIMALADLAGEGQHTSVLVPVCRMIEDFARQHFDDWAREHLRRIESTLVISAEEQKAWISTDYVAHALLRAREAFVRQAAMEAVTVEERSTIPERERRWTLRATFVRGRP